MIIDKAYTNDPMILLSTQSRRQLKQNLPWLVLLAILIINFFFLKFNAFRTFYFLDLSGFFDAAWRIYCGQRPYIDFISYCGTIHFYMTAFFFYIFGFGKMAILTHLVVISSLIIGASFLIARKGALGLPLSILSALLTMTSFYWPISHPWYNQSAHFWGLLAVTFFILRSPFKHPIYESLIVSLLLVFSFITKFNIGFVYVLLFAVLFFFLNNKLKMFIGSLIGLAIGMLILRLVFIPSFKGFYEQCFGLGSTQTFRIIHTLHPLNFLKNYYWIPGILVLLNVRYLSKQYKEYLIIFYGLWFIGIFSTYTSNIVFEADVEVMGIYFTLAFVLMKQSLRMPGSRLLNKLRLFSFKFLVCAAFGLTILYAKYGLELKAWAFPDYVKYYPGQKVNPVGDYAMKNKPLKGWLCDKDKGEPVDQIVEFFEKGIPKDQSLLVLTDLQILYALTGRDSYRQIPWTYTIGFSPLWGKQRNEVRQYILDHPPDWIVTHDQRVCPIVNGIVTYLKFSKFIDDNYITVRKFGAYRLLVKRTLARSFI